MCSESFWKNMTAVNVECCGVCFPQECCWSSEKLCEDECDIMVPGEQLKHAAPVATGDDLRGPGRLRAHAAGERPEAIGSVAILEVA